MAMVATQAAKESSNIWVSECLQRDCPGMPLSEVAGVALISDLPFDSHHTVNLYLCRVEHIYNVTWGGNPDKPVDYREGGSMVSPRRSFEAWVEQRLGHSRPWTKSTRLHLLKLRALLQQAKTIPWRQNEA
jgi:light-regulated signal transduction histidine kinase (bacteriophytochrome)